MPAAGTGPLCRALRCGVLSVVIVALAAAAHRGAGGPLPPLATMALLCGGGALAMSSVTVRPLRTVPAALVVCLGQLVLHVTFTVVAPHPELAGATGHHHGAAIPPMPTMTSSLAPHLDVADPATATMLGAHLLAGALVGVWLSLGERAAWHLVARMVTAAADAGRALGLFSPAAGRAALCHPIQRPARAAATHSVRLPAATAVLRSTLIRRGPPARA